MAENLPRSEAMLSKIILNQRMMMEQNRRLLEEKQQARENEHERQLSNGKIPLLVQVYFRKTLVLFIGFVVVVQKNKSLFQRQCILTNNSAFWPTTIHKTSKI